MAFPLLSLCDTPLACLVLVTGCNVEEHTAWQLSLAEAKQLPGFEQSVVSIEHMLLPGTAAAMLEPRIRIVAAGPPLAVWVGRLQQRCQPLAAQRASHDAGVGQAGGLRR